MTKKMSKGLSAHLAKMLVGADTRNFQDIIRSSKFASPGGGPGYRRMLARLGPAGYDALCEDSLRRKEEALAEAARGHRTDPTRDRETYQDYPPPSGSKPRATKS